MDVIYNLENSLVDACVVIGMDEFTGLNQCSGSKPNNISMGPYQLNVLGVLTGTTAFFPQTTERVDGGHFYPENRVICPLATKSNLPSGKAVNKIRRSLSMAPQAMPFSSEVVQSLPTFCFPDGGHVYHANKEPYMHYLVLTNIDGGRSYGCCLISYRSFSAVKVSQLTGNYELLPPDEDPQTKILYVPVCICLVSKYPYFNVMKNMLSSLLPYLKTGESIWKPLLRFASHVSSIPVPPAGKLSIEVSLFDTHHVVPAADEPDRRAIDLDWHLPLLLLSVDDIVKVITSILTQQRIIFLSSSYQILTLVIESFFTFIDPFRWRLTYVPVLPNKLADLIEAPGPFIMGCHSSIRNQVRQVRKLPEIPAIIVVDLDKQTVNEDPKCKLPVMPDSVSQALAVRLRKSKYQYDLELIKSPTFYSLEEAKRHREQFLAEFQRSIKTACLDTMVSLFGDVLLHMRVGEKFFDKDGYLQSILEDDHPFYRETCASDCFDRFIDERLENPGKRDAFAVLAEKVVAARKTVNRNRSSSNVSQLRKHASLSAFAPFEDPKVVYQLPSLLDEGIHNGSYFQFCLKSLTESIEGLEGRNVSLKASYLYLRGMMYVASKQPIKGLDDFHSLYSANPELFPRELVSKVMMSLDDKMEGKLKEQDFYKRTAAFQHFLRKTEEQRSRPSNRRLPSDPVGEAEFKKKMKTLQIAKSDEVAEWLFRMLTAEEGSDIVTPEQFKVLYDTLGEVERTMDTMDVPGAKIEDNEQVLMCSSLINTTKGVGRIMMTTNLLYFLSDGARVCELVTRLHDIKEIIKYQHYVVFPPGVAALRIVNKDRNIPPFFACFKEERNIWVCFLNEMAGGHEFAYSLKDPKIIEIAANNVTLANVLVRMGIPEKVAEETCMYARRRDSGREELSEDTREALERRLDPCVRETNRTTVMTVAYVPGRTANDSATLWCGMGSGAIMVYETESWTCVSELRYARNRISCLTPVGENQVWAGSYDTVIYVINTDTRKAEQQLQNHTDYICDVLNVDPREEEDEREVWSASLNGQIILWNPESRESIRQISLQKVKTLRKLMVIGEKLWCATDDVIFVVDPGSGATLKKLKNLDDVGLPELMQCAVKISEKQVWTSGGGKGEFLIWNTTSYESKKVKIDENIRPSVMLAIGDNVWIGCTNGKVFIVDTEDYTQERELHAHTDTVKSICVTSEGHVITGSGSKEGKLCVWNAFVKDRYDSADSLGFEVVDGKSRKTRKVKYKE